MNVADRFSSLKPFEIIIFLVTIILIALCMVSSQVIVTEDADVRPPWSEEIPS
jgi:hypothetical protein